MMPGLKELFLRMRGVTKEEYLKAASDGDIDVVRAYLAANKDNPAAINVRDSAAAMRIGCTALILAAKNGRVEVVRALMAAPGIDVHAIDDNSYTAFTFAAVAGHAAIVREFLANPNVDLIKCYAATAAELAPRAGHPETAQMINEAIAARAQAATAPTSAPDALLPPSVPVALTPVPAVPVEASVVIAGNISPERYLQAARDGRFLEVDNYVGLNRNNATAINVTDPDGNTALILAVDGMKIDVVRRLVDIPQLDLMARTRNTHQTAKEIARAHPYYRSEILDLINAAVAAREQVAAAPASVTSAEAQFSISRALRDIARAREQTAAVPANVPVVAPAAPPSVSASLILLGLQLSADQRAAILPHMLNMLRPELDARGVQASAAAQVPVVVSGDVSAEQYLQGAGAGRRETVRAYLLANRGNPAAINIIDPVTGNTALIMAAMHGYAFVVSELQNTQEVNTQITNRAGLTAAAAAQNNGYLQIAMQLARVNPDVVVPASAPAPSAPAAPPAPTLSQPAARPAPLTFSERLEAIGYTGPIPAHLKDSILLGIMNDPIAVSSGKTYDRESLRDWFAKFDSRRTPTCPETRVPLQREELNRPTHTNTKDLLEKFVAKQEKKAALAKAKAEAEKAAVATATEQIEQPIDLERVRTTRLRLFAPTPEQVQAVTPAASAEAVIPSTTRTTQDSSSADSGSPYTPK
jgi:ankyrin repeat protein